MVDINSIKKIDYWYTVLGTSPLANANSFSLFAKLNQDVSIGKIRYIVSDIELEIGNRGSRDQIEPMIKTLKSNLNEVNKSLLKTIDLQVEQDKDVILISEYDLIHSMKKVYDNMTKHVDERDVVVVDFSGGRKVMGVASTLGAIKAANKKHFDLYFVYYLLIPWDREKMQLRLPKLNIDEVRIDIWSMEEIENAI